MLQNKYDFILVFDVTNGNPNGDPDAGNEPRTDAETGHGYVTDVCIKRKVRNYIDLIKDGEPGYNILIKNDLPLNDKFKVAYEEEGLPVDKTSKGTNPSIEKQARDYMCKNYYDVRTFGAVMSTGNNSCGIVRGPVQFSFANSVSPVFVDNITITRQAVTKAEDAKRKENEMGNKSIIPYGLYRMDGHVSAALANKTTNLSDEDIELLWTALLNMFEEDRSAARGEMEVRGLYIFKHDSVLGNARFSELSNKIKIQLKEGVVAPRKFNDYIVTVDDDVPDGVELIVK
ncbi:MAG: type I-C CRISPR-associated protein Cas7/Csd2 [Lachnospiraceae bacterium]|jgi:CRISPR-associated protein Csd2|nr:type I-C CRISPR-associated protein Cas7/Csd2 [Lachnospiraceae bacterium]MCI1657031.1 type I-C CRISPR-associated protein Cas7/Csd2 [Lachnospiraceae bacterium]MCI2195544.1 type I-C CRISPR-associated protein Cas7/Csd2 [Lachnospiraceae bacterium]